ncbi:MAG: N-acetyl-gamma-glutamyl-phosphate reductase [Rickettsiales bacterium]
MTQSISTVILGASGYTGAELLRLLRGHPAFNIVALTGDSQAGKPIEHVYPHLRGQNLPTLVKHTEVDFTDVQLVFCCLPHGTTQEIIAGLPAHVRIVDLSADFRLHDVAEYAAWYGHEHRAPQLQNDAVYGLTELNRERIKASRLVANPGCYPTSVLLPLVPLTHAKLIDPTCLFIDSQSGVSGAGRSVKQELLFTELEGGVSAYGIGHHRHMAEMEQELRAASGVADLTVSFTPHLVPITRGMLSTIHVRLSEGVSADDARAHLTQRFANEPFVTVLTTGAASTHQVRGTNQCVMSAHVGRTARELILVSVIDNLVKGASGQALQNANLMFGLPETTNLELTAIFP